jgi:hypothetical protein
MCPSSVEPLDYVACWEDEDGLSRVGGNYARGAVEHELWPWLKQMGFADDDDDAVLLRFLDEFLGNWPANMRPGLRFRRDWKLNETAGLSSALAETIRNQFDAVFAAAREPALQAASYSLGALPASAGNRPAGKLRPVRRPDPLTRTLIWPNSGRGNRRRVRRSCVTLGRWACPRRRSPGKRRPVHNLTCANDITPPGRRPGSPAEKLPWKTPGASSQNAQRGRTLDGGRAGGGAELHVGVAHVCLHRIERQVQLRCHFGVGEPFGQLFQHS